MMRTTLIERMGDVAKWLACILFAVFAGNIVLAKVSSLMYTDIPLLPELAEFLLLLGATASFIAYALVREAQE